MNLPFEMGPIRPVAEANSLIVRVTRGCPWNRCAFCTSYKSKNIEFSRRTVEEVKKDIDAIYKTYGHLGYKSCFLQDGDIFCLPTDELIEILTYIKEKFPNIDTITSYGIIHNIAKKSQEEINQLHDAGLNRVYCGMETGSDTILRLIRKGATAKMQINAGKMLKSAGIEVSYFIVLGIGGTQYSEENAIETARVLNEIDPDFIRVRTIRVKPGSELETMTLAGDYVLPTEEDMIREQRTLLNNLSASSYYSNDHSMNLMMELEGRLPEDKQVLLSVMDEYLSLSDEDRRVFNFGVRLFRMRKLKDLGNASVRGEVTQIMNEITENNVKVSDASLLNYLRVKFTSS